ncbi:MAG: prephenate dehydratase [bacterium]
MRVAYLGPEGTNSEEAALKYYHRRARLLPYPNIYDVIMAVQKGKVDQGFCPIENSIEGAVTEVLDLLTQYTSLKIRDEFLYPITNNLISKKNIPLSRITDVISHPQAIAQCSKFIKKNIPKAFIHFSSSTAEAVRQAPLLAGQAEFDSEDHVKERIYTAIGSKTAAKIYRLKVIKKNINDHKDNMTRFVVLSKKDHPRTGDDKTSIVFSIHKDKPGGLYNVLHELAIRSINMTKIESRPSKLSYGDYYFFIDMQGHRDDKVIQESLCMIKKKASYFTILGSYPRNH